MRASRSSTEGAQWVGVETTILRLRHDFLRPVSLVAVIVLTDENDSEIDVRSYQGRGYGFMASTYEPYRGTQACATNPADPSCTSCANVADAASDPSCAQGRYAYGDLTNWGSNLNLRHVHMKAKYGADPQFPIARYVTGLTSPMVPDRVAEQLIDVGYYAAQNDLHLNVSCRLGSSTGTELDQASAATAEIPVRRRDGSVISSSPRRAGKGNIFYAIIGGVPNQLLHFDQTTGTNNPDWVRILGKSPDTYDYTGIDVHMVESYAPRVGLSYVAPPLAGETVPTDPTKADRPCDRSVERARVDRWTAREPGLYVDLPGRDRQYACTFKIAGPPRDCSNSMVNGALVWTVPENEYAVTVPPRTPRPCGGTSRFAIRPKPTNQIAANKAYPTIRELNLANKLGGAGDRSPRSA